MHSHLSEEARKEKHRLYVREYKKTWRRKQRARNRSGRTNHQIEPHPPDADLEARLAEIPIDTRSITGKAFGDPVFERSALAAVMKPS